MTPRTGDPQGEPQVVPISRDTIRRIQTHIDRLGSSDSSLSQEAEHRLIRFGSKAVPALSEAVRSDDPQVRYRAVWALGKSGDSRAFEPVVSLIRDPDGAVAYDAILALGKLGDRRAVPLLAERLRETAGVNLGLNSAANTALAELGIDLLPIWEEIARSENTRVRQHAREMIAGLREIEDSETPGQPAAQSA